MVETVAHRKKVFYKIRTSIALQTVLKAFTRLISDDKLFHVLTILLDKDLCPF